VTYPKNKTRIGVLKKIHNQIMFHALDSKFGDMIVRDITPEVFQTIKVDTEFLGSYSYIRKSAIDPKYLEKHFFKAEFLTWEVNEVSPYCKIVEDLGPLFEESNYRKRIMLNQGISEEMYP
jgi:exoribonuclease R